AYKNGNWSYNGENFLVIHRLCVNPEFQNRGIGKFICLEIETMARLKNCQSIRLDCFTLNPISLKLYASLGYRETGFADWRKGRFVLMEKTNLR
ncbi:MAG: GNAT family N-acetyltransferase, partial [Treponema sp.]|nr:GNAT family N-acetyltransferase [Candidatus Treponema equifaecale]